VNGLSPQRVKRINDIIDEFDAVAETKGRGVVIRGLAGALESVEHELAKVEAAHSVQIGEKKP